MILTLKNTTTWWVVGVDMKDKASIQRKKEGSDMGALGSKNQDTVTRRVGAEASGRAQIS